MFKNTIAVGLLFSAASTLGIGADLPDPLTNQANSHLKHNPTHMETNMMNYMDRSVVEECTEGSFAGKLTFPQCLQKLIAIGVDSYRVDLSPTRSTKVVHGTKGETYEEVFPAFDAPAVASVFNPAQIKETLSAIQKKEIEYPEFLRRIMEAGVSFYEVFIQEGKTIYSNQNGESYKEVFPKDLLKL